MNKTRHKLLIIAGALAVIVAGAVYLINRSVEHFAGTDVPYVAGNPEAGEVSCEGYSGTLKGLTGNSDGIVLGTVVSEKILFENVYGIDSPKEVDGALPPQRGGYLNRALEFSVDQVVQGPEVDSVVLVVEGWEYDENREAWAPWAIEGRHRLMPGDRAVVPLIKSIPDDPGAVPGSFGVTCTGPFMIKDGRVASGTSTVFADEGVLSMTEGELIEAFREAAG